MLSYYSYDFVSKEALNDLVGEAPGRFRKATIKYCYIINMQRLLRIVLINIAQQYVNGSNAFIIYDVFKSGYIVL